MTNLSPTAWLQLSEHYRQMSDDELINLAHESSGLTDTAQQILAQEFRSRGLTPPPAEPSASPRPAPPSDSEAEDEDCALTEVCTVWSRADAARLQTALDTAGIPFYMGPEKASTFDAVTSDFSQGVSVQVMRIGAPYAFDALRRDYTPVDEPADTQAEQNNEDLAIHCPKCHSEDVTFDQLVNEPAGENAPPQYQWTCNSCGNEWEDDGVETSQ